MPPAMIEFSDCIFNSNLVDIPLVGALLPGLIIGRGGLGSHYP